VLAEVIRQARLPNGVLNIVFGDGATTGSSLVKHPKVKGISFTGGTATGIQIRKDTAADIYKHLSLELGGKNPTLVFGDVGMEKAVATAAAAAFENQGEVCCVISDYGERGADFADLSLWVQDLCCGRDIRGFRERVHGFRETEL
jgi:acyl-CoA reductase-like NAD-dependent aldehyde dehydrogenase